MEDGLNSEACAMAAARPSPVRVPPNRGKGVRLDVYKWREKLYHLACRNEAQKS